MATGACVLFVVAKLSVPVYEHTMKAYVGGEVGIHVFVTSNTICQRLIKFMFLTLCPLETASSALQVGCPQSSRFVRS